MATAQYTRQIARHRARSRYTTLDGHTLDLGGLSQEEYAFFERCYGIYRSGQTAQDFTALSNLVAGWENPLVRAAHGRITRAVWEQPLFQAVRDLEDRVGVRTGELESAPGDLTNRDPLEDRWVPSVEAAALKRVTLKGLHKAIARGDVLARPARPGGRRLLISERSLDHWVPAAARQAARRKAAPNR